MAIWLIGGTSESRELAIALADRQIPFVVTATTEQARQIYVSIDRLDDWAQLGDIDNPCNHADRLSIQAIRIGKLSNADLDRFLKRARITSILDASHPFATEISSLAIAHSQEHQLPYLRFERNNLSTNYQANIEQQAVNSAAKPDHPDNQDHIAKEFGWDQSTAISKDNSVDEAHNDRSPRSNHQSSLVVNIPSLDYLFTPAIAREYLINQNVLLTLGCKSLGSFKDWHNRAQLFARILPQPESIAMAEQAGFCPKQLIAIRPPISTGLEKALWQQWQIQTVVTKASGKAGGEDVKRSIAAQLNVPLIIIARTQIKYPAQTNQMAQAIAFCQKWSNP
jgi:precorrin-6A/cobalt-precorrin-6A reductase